VIVRLCLGHKRLGGKSITYANTKEKSTISPGGERDDAGTRHAPRGPAATRGRNGGERGVD